MPSHHPSSTSRGPSGRGGVVVVFVAVALLGALLGACDAGFDGPFPTLPPVREVAVTRELVVSVGPSPVRFRVPVRVSPPSVNARLDVVVASASRPLRAELIPEPFAGSGPEAWSLVDTGGVVQTFLSGLESEDLRLSLAHDTADVADPLALRLSLQLFSPGDVDFDGVDDGVSVAIDPLTPLPP